MLAPLLLCCLSVPSAPAPEPRPPRVVPPPPILPYVHPDFWHFADEETARDQVRFLDARLAWLHALRAPLTWGAAGGEQLSDEQLQLDAAIADAEARRRPWLSLWMAYVAARAETPEDPWTGEIGELSAAALDAYRAGAVFGWMESLRGELGDLDYARGAMPGPIAPQFMRPIP